MCYLWNATSAAMVKAGRQTEANIKKTPQLHRHISNASCGTMYLGGTKKMTVEGFKHVYCDIGGTNDGLDTYIWL